MHFSLGYASKWEYRLSLMCRIIWTYFRFIPWQPKLTIWMNKDYLMIQSFKVSLNAFFSRICLKMGIQAQFDVQNPLNLLQVHSVTTHNWPFEWTKTTWWFKVSLNAFFSRICLKMGIQTLFDVQNHLNLLWVHSVATKIDHLNEQRLLDDAKFP